FHAQEREAVMPRVGTRVVHDRAPLEVADELQHAAEAEGHAVFQFAHRLGAQHLGVPARGLLEVAARHRDVRDIEAGRDRGVVQQPFLQFEIGVTHAVQASFVNSSTSALSADCTRPCSLSSLAKSLRASLVSERRAEASMSAQYRLSRVAPTLALHDLSECAERAISGASFALAACFSFCTSFGDSTR